MIRTRLINAVFTVAIITGVVVMLWFILPRLSRLTSSAPPKIATTPEILVEVKKLSQLVTVKYVMEKVIIIDDPKWYPGGESKVLMVAHGNVLAGINLADMKDDDITVTDKKISIKLPPSRAPLDYTYLDDRHTQVIERSTGLLRSFDKDLEQNARRQAVMDINRAARDAGIEKDATDRAKQVLTALYQPLGYTVEFQTP